MVSNTEPLIFGVEYNLWREGEYIGRAVWTDDKNIGPSFIGKSDEEGNKINEVYIADKWESTKEK
jgi:hypothetical protein